MEEGSRKVFQVFDEHVVCLCPVHRKVKAVFVALHGVGEIAGVGSVRDDEYLQIFIQRTLAVEALLTVSMHLVECFANCYATFLQFHLHHGQSVHQDGHVVAVHLRARLFKLVDDLHLVSGNVLFVHQIDILNMPIVEHEVVDIIVLHLACLVHDAVAGFVQIFVQEALPFFIGEDGVVERLQLFAHIYQQSLWCYELWQIFIALVHQIFYQLTL